MMRLFDLEDYYDVLEDFVLSDKYQDDAEEMMEDLLTKGAVRFDGGRFFYQFRMDYSGGYTGEFVVPGIPADKEYFLYVTVFDREITSIDDMEDAEADVYMEMHYFDPDYYDISSVLDENMTGLSKGWYYFYDWGYDEVSGPPALGAETRVWVPGSSPVSNQPFLVKPGDDTSIDILLVEDPEEIPPPPPM